MYSRKSAYAFAATLTLSVLSATSFAAASFNGVATAQVQMTSGSPLVSFLPVSSNLYVAGNFIAPGTLSAGAGQTTTSSFVASLPTLQTFSTASGFADANTTGYADATAQSMAFAAFSVINNSKNTINYTLHFKGQATASGSAGSAADWFYIDSAFVLNKNSVPQFSGFWVWGQSGPGSQSLDTGVQEFDVNASLFAGQTATWSIQTTVNGYAQSNPVPEPASLAILGFGASALVARRRRK